MLSDACIMSLSICSTNRGSPKFGAGSGSNNDAWGVVEEEGADGIGGGFADDAAADDDDDAAAAAVAAAAVAVVIRKFLNVIDEW